MKKFLNKQRAQEAEERKKDKILKKHRKPGKVKGPRISQKKKRCKKTERAQRTKDDAMPKTGSEKSEDGGKIGEDIASGK